MSTTLPPLKQVFGIKHAPAPWRRLWGTGLTTLLALGGGLALGHWEWGVWGFMGGFGSLYVQDQPYRSRAATLALVGLGLVASMGLGAHSSLWWSSALSLAFVAGGSTFVAETFDLPLPSAFMFILVACISAALPLHPSTVPLRVICVAGGAAVAWLVGMMDRLWDPRGPASRHLAQAFQSLARYSGEIQSEPARSHAAAAIRTAQRAAKLARDRRLELGADAAGKTFRALIRISTTEKQPLPLTWSKALTSVAENIRHPAKFKTVKLTLPTTQSPSGGNWRQLRQSVTEAAHVATATKPHLISNVEHSAFKTRLGKSIYPEVLVLPSALRMGIAVLFSVAIAHFLGIAHPFWVPLTCAAVLQGLTTAAIAQRSLQRVMGTTIGLILAGTLLSLHPSSYTAAIFIIALQLAMLYFIAKNYGISVVFITSLALVVIYSGTHAAAIPLMWARLKDTLLGSLIGTIAALTLWRRASSVQLPEASIEVITRTKRLIEVILNETDLTRLTATRDKCLRALLAMHHLYENALGEMEPTAETIDEDLILGIEQLGYLVLALPGVKKAQADLAEALIPVWDALINRCHGQSAGNVTIPPMAQYPAIAHQLRYLLGQPEAPHKAEK